MKPTVGRIVHVYTDDQARWSNGVGRGPYAGIITQVYTDDCVNVFVLPPFATPWETASCLRDIGTHRWAWPPREHPAVEAMEEHAHLTS